MGLRISYTRLGIRPKMSQISDPAHKQSVIPTIYIGIDIVCM